MEITITGWIVLGLTNIPFYVLYGWVIFSDTEEFFEAVKFWLMPDLISALNGEYWDDVWAEWKLIIWFGACAGTVVLEVALLQNYVQ